MPRNTKNHSGSFLYWSAESWAILFLRIFLSLRFLTVGLGKFKSPENGYSFSYYYDTKIPALKGMFAESFLPGFLTSGFLYTIAYVEIILGILLLLGIKTKYVLAAFGLTLVALAFGLMVVGNPDVNTKVGILLIMNCAALYFVRHNKLELMR